MMMTFLHNLDFYQIIVKGLEFTRNYGFFPMYINPVANNYMGSANSIAMPHLLLYIPAYIYHITKDISLSFNIFFIILNILQIIFMYICLVGLTGKKRGSIIGAVLYVSIFLFTLNTFLRVGLSEYIAITFLPLVVYGFHNIYFNDSKNRIVLLIALFFIAESNVTITLLTIAFMVIFCAIFFIKSIFNMKILRIVFVLVALVILTAFTYVPMVHYYMLKQFSIVNIIGNMGVIITSLIVMLMVFIYIMICKSIIKRINSKILKVTFSVVVVLLFLCSAFMYGFFYKTTDKMKIIDNVDCVDEVFLPQVDESYYTNNEAYLKELYSNCGTSVYDIRVNSFNQSCLFMNIEYEASPYFDKSVLDIPYFNFIGFKAYDKDYKALPLTYGIANECRVIVPSGSGQLKVGFEAPTIWMMALVISVVGFFMLVIIRIIKEILSYKKVLKEDIKKDNTGEIAALKEL